MKNDLRYAEDTPTGICMAYGGQHECEKWPELFPSPCCWLSCTELCGAACWRGNLVAERCKLYKPVFNLLPIIIPLRNLTFSSYLY